MDQKEENSIKIIQNPLRHKTDSMADNPPI